jgi:hypothetical protein
MYMVSLTRERRVVGIPSLRFLRENIAFFPLTFLVEKVLLGKELDLVVLLPDLFIVELLLLSAVDLLPVVV